MKSLRKVGALVALLCILSASPSAPACTATVSIAIQADRMALSDDSADFVTVTLSWGSCPSNATIAFGYGGDGAIHLHESGGGDLQEHGGPFGSVTLLAEGFTASTTLPGASITAQAVIMQTPPDPPIPISQPSTASKPVVGVKSPLMYWNGAEYVEITSRPYILKDSCVAFKATPSVGEDWPSGKPIWKLGDETIGQGETVGILFLAKGDKDLKATTGASPVTRSLTVYDLIPQHEPELPYRFDGRSTDAYGVLEVANLKFATDPVGLDPATLGGLRWYVSGGSGEVLNDPNDVGTGKYNAPITAFNVTLRLAVVSGPSFGYFKEMGFNVKAPTGTRMERVHPGVVWHDQPGTASAGILLYYYLEPKDVSFQNLHFWESFGAVSNVSGYFAKAKPNGKFPSGGGWSDHIAKSFVPQPGQGACIMGGNSTTGCRVLLPDYASTGGASDWGGVAGTWTWTIPTLYGKDTDLYMFGNPVVQTGAFAANGDATITKGTQQGTATINAAHSEY